MAEISREILRWLLSLNINVHHEKLKWCVSNGLLVAEIIHNYYPKSVNLQKFNDGQGITVKLENWKLLNEIFRCLNIYVPQDIIEGVIFNKSNAAVILLTLLYELLTRKKTAQSVTFDPTDLEYQCSLPIHARSCLAKFIKDNVSSSELVTKPDIFTNKKKYQSLVIAYRTMKVTERINEPCRYRVFRPLGLKCRRSERSELREINNNEGANTVPKGYLA
uniref:Calponin-homology (CH) domain-containing protein n=1 Tax=Trichobilharzia regenti TaxID=157069 RepID=A0AA85IS81_TRIRE|nr:unnamed protein product [Trichobilharzia regenti]